MRWDPEGRADEAELLEIDELETDPLLIEGLAEDEDVALEGDDADVGGHPGAGAGARGRPGRRRGGRGGVDRRRREPVEVEAEALVSTDPEEIEEISLEEVDEPDDVDDEDEPAV